MMTFYETRPHIKNGKPISYANITVLTLRSKIKGHTEVKDVHNYSIIAIHSCTKYGMTRSNDKIAVDRTRSKVENLINLTLGSKVNCINVEAFYNSDNVSEFETLFYY